MWKRLKIFTSFQIWIILTTFFNPIFSDNFCLSSQTLELDSSPDDLPDEYKCLNIDPNLPTITTTTPHSSLSTSKMKPFQEDPGSVFGQLNYCLLMYIFDISTTKLTEEKFKALQVFLDETTTTCFKNKIGSAVTFYNFKQIDNRTKEFFQPIDECCDMEFCESHIFTAKMNDLVYDFSPNDLAYNYMALLSQMLKKQTAFPCNKNSVILITDRLVDVSKEYAEFHKIFSTTCAYFTVIVVDDSAATLNDIKLVYSEVTSDVYRISDYNCLTNVVGCLGSCRNNNTNCKNEILTSCASPTLPTTTTTPTPPTPTERYPNGSHALYTFALSNNSTEKDFEIILNAIKNSIHQSTKVNFSFAIVLDSETISPWMTTAEDLEDYTKNTVELFSTTIIHEALLYDQDDEHTTKRLNATMQRKPYGQPPAPEIILVTDFVSYKFIDAYETISSVFATTLVHYNFHIACTVKEVFAFYNTTNLSTRVSFYDYNDPNSMLPPIDGSPPNPTTSRPINNEKISEKTVLIIIFGAIGGSLTLFCAGSFIYRQRMSWKAKLESIRANHHKKDEEHVDVTLDYWELTWDRLLVKSDKLGSGAFGQVLRGKIIGKPPCVDHFYVNLQQRNVTQMENADVAIKMLPKYADDAAKKEFMNEIELMKLIGYHENIVNMLGCVTVGHPLCLVLEFCPFRDLHQYVKARKVEVTISTSIEEKINHTKDFLIFAWQIAHGMKFLASKSIIHRDLAARNILIDSDRNAKISDFGLCIHASENMGSVRKNTIAVSATGRLPIKWLAIESLKKHEFSLKSDIWSFGIVLYEMYSFGEVPFSKIEPKDLIEHLERGNRPEKPELCTKEIYDVMMKCWNENPEDRPSFEELLTVFTVFLERSTETYGYLPLLKTENAPLANETNCKTNDGVADSKKTRKSDSFNFFGALSRRWSTISGNKNDSRTELNETVVPGPSNPKWMKNYYEDHPDLEIGNRSRFQSFISDSVASTHGSMDPGVEMINGRPRLRNQLSENFASTNSSMRKSLSFNHADRKPDNHDNRRMSFGLKQLFLKKFKQESNHNTPEK